MAACVKAAQSARTNVSVAFWTDSEPLASSSKTGSFPPIAKVSRYDMRPEPYAVIPLVRICAGGGWVTTVSTATILPAARTLRSFCSEIIYSFRLINGIANPILITVLNYIYFVNATIFGIKIYFYIGFLHGSSRLDLRQ